MDANSAGRTSVLPLRQLVLAGGLALTLALAPARAPACTTVPPDPPIIWRLTQPTPPGADRMFWVGIEADLFFGGGVQNCTCGLGLLGPVPPNARIERVLFTVTKAVHPPFGVGLTPPGIPLTSFDLSPDPTGKTSALLREGGALPDGQWTGFAGDVDFGALNSELAAIAETQPDAVRRSLATNNFVIVPPWVVKIWFKFTVPAPDLGPFLDPVMALQIATGSLNDPLHPVSYTDVADNQKLTADPLSGTRLPINLSGRLNGENVQEVLVELFDISTTGGDEPNSYVFQYKLPKPDDILPFPVPIHWWIKKLEPIGNYKGVFECWGPDQPMWCDTLTTPMLPEESLKESFAMRRANGDNITGSDTFFDVFFDVSRGGGQTRAQYVDYEFDANLQNSVEGSDVVPESSTKFVLFPAGGPTLNPQGEVTLVKPGLPPAPPDVFDGFVDLIPIPLPGPPPVLEQSLEVRVFTTYVDEPGHILIKKEFQWNPVELNPNENACLADLNGNNRPDIQDVGRFRNGFFDPQPCRLNDPIPGFPEF